MALTRIGVDQIVALTDSSKQARLCASNFLTCLDAVLERWDWVCARHRTSITADAAPPAHTWSYRYLLPTSPYCLRLLDVRDSDANKVEYLLEGRYILCEVSDGLDIRYTKRITAYPEMSAELTAAVALKLAKILIPSFSWTAARKKDVDNDFLESIALAKVSGAAQDYSTDEKENSATYGGNSEWVDAGR